MSLLSVSSKLPRRLAITNSEKSGFRNLDDALSLFRKMLKMRPLLCDFYFNQLLTSLVKMKQYSVAISLFREMCTLSIPVNIYTFTIAINCYCHCDRLDYSFSLLAAIFKRGFVPNVVTDNTLIRGLHSQHKSAEARLFFTNLIKFREIQPDVVTFTTMIDGLCKTGDFDMALGLFGFMQKSDCKPNIVTYSTIINYLFKRGLVDEALTLLSEMMEIGILPNVKTYSPLIQVLCSLNRWEEVGMLLKHMIDDIKISPDVHTYTIFLDAYPKSGKLDNAKHIIEIMHERGEYPDIVTYNTLMHSYCLQGQMDGALAVFNTIRSEKIVPNCYTYNIMLDAYCKELKLDIAMDLYRKMASEGLSPTVVTHNMLLHGLCKSHYVDKALSFFRAMECNGLKPNCDTYNIIIRGCLRNKEYNKASKLVDKMLDCGFLADAFTTSLLQHLLLSEANPTLLAMHQKCLH